jgi:hypothetical protein
MLARPGANAFARDHGLEDTFVYLYARTLSIKHDRSCLLALAEHFADQPDVTVVVVSEGLGATWLEDHCSHLPGLLQLPCQPYEQLPDLLASADVLIAILEPDAGVFSVPSKVKRRLVCEVPAATGSAP